MTEKMKIKKEHFLDKSEPDDEGYYEYYYEGYNYEIILDNVIYSARSYNDTPNEISFLRHKSPKNKWNFFCSIPYKDKDFTYVIKNLSQNYNFEIFKVLLKDNGYQDINLSKII